ncbi:thioredoxin family protein [Bacillus spizizenii]|uniref:Thioredoxin n=1 Tax=Bacillus spizizenii TaxID=96241 RepID=A0A9Q4DRX6_BACSC|nr:thioredoxin family protein [Bacillus spizizenii]MCY8155529.1 thioredoxin family protein [Bacillus spizizenii]MCY8312927.1 thioredoxin family protein [Bacillus spizizenii]MCY8416658.1 thioredoxin family protein [Bacillus spizizenii]MCY9333732.1 thioredoxin family protein [Bacillus spizizenii]
MTILILSLEKSAAGVGANMVDVTGMNSFSEEIKDGVSLVYVYAPWCGPCKVISPALVDLSEQYPDVKFLKVNSETGADILTMLGVSTIPTVLIFKDGKRFSEDVGFRPNSIFEKNLKNAISRSE